MKCFYQYLVYDQHGKFGSGGYSRNAKHKPLPRVVEGVCEIAENGDMALTVDGVRKRKFNMLCANGNTCADYPDIVPAWWKDKLAVTCKFAELNHE